MYLDKKLSESTLFDLACVAFAASIANSDNLLSDEDVSGRAIALARSLNNEMVDHFTVNGALRLKQTPPPPPPRPERIKATKFSG